jgi:hypothetical protein
LWRPQTYLDFVAAPKAEAAAAAKPAAASTSLFGGGGGSSFFGGSSLFGGSAMKPAATSSLLGGAPATPAASQPALGEGAAFWRKAEAHDGFTSRHFAVDFEAQLRKSDAVLLRQPGSSTGSPPRFSLLVFGTEYAAATDMGGPFVGLRYAQNAGSGLRARALISFIPRALQVGGG